MTIFVMLEMWFVSAETPRLYILETIKRSCIRHKSAIRKVYGDGATTASVQTFNINYHQQCTLYSLENWYVRTDTTHAIYNTHRVLHDCDGSVVLREQ